MHHRILCLLFITGLCAPAQAALFLAQETAIELAGQLEALPDIAGQFTIAEVAAGRAGEFLPLPGHFVAGFGRAQGVWLRFTAQRSVDAPSQWLLRVLPTYLDQLVLYYPDKQGGWRSLASGDNLPFAQRALDDRAVVFPVELPAEQTQTFYLYARHDGNFNVYLSLYTPDGLRRAVLTESLLFGTYFGVLLALLVINALHGFVLRERIYVEFTGYLVIRGFYFLAYNGYLYQYLLPEQPALAHDLLQLLLALVVASTASFLVRILDMSAVLPRLARVCYFLAALAMLPIVSIGFGLFSRFAGLLSLIIIFVGAAGSFTAFVHWRRGTRLAGLLLAVMLFFLIGISFTALASLGLHSSLITDLYGTQVASAFIFLALHFSVAVKVLEIKQAKAASDKAAYLAEEMAQRERAARREQSDFVAMLFHEIKTPLAVIDSAATVLEHLDDGSQNETQRRYDAIHGAVERLNLLVEQSLTSDRQGLDQVHLNLQPIDFGTLARIVFESFRGVAKQRLSLEVPDKLPLVQGDPEFLRVALANLIDNAIKYSPADSVIRVEICRQDHALTLSVSDQGLGMENTARIFDRYWRGNRTAGITGAGLGLYLVRRIIQAHGGTVQVDSTVGQGSRFSWVFPLDATEPLTMLGHSA